MKVLGIIPARGGSKSIPLKNIMPLNKKPLVEYTIETAISAKLFDRLIVSTDHQEIAEVCKKYHEIEVIMRPPEIATDESPTELALLHVCDVLERQYQFSPDIILTLEPTSPLRTVTTISNCIKVFQTTKADSVIAVTETKACIGKAVNGYFTFLFSGQARRRQEREIYYIESGTIYGTLYSTLIQKKSVLGNRIFPLIIPNFEAIDINETEDFKMAEKIISITEKMNQ